MPQRRMMMARRRGVNWWDGLSDVVAVYQPIGAASLAASYVNLVNPGVNDAAPGVAPAFDPATGWGLNGTTQYLTTGIVPSANHAMIIRFSNAQANATLDRVIIGVWVHGAGNNRYWISPQWMNGTQRAYGYGNAATTPSGGVAGGVLAINGNTAYKDGLSDGALSAFSGTATQAIYIGTANLDNAAILPRLIAANIQAVAICSTVQSAAQIAAASAAMAALT
jgi:hypothetical protein